MLFFAFAGYARIATMGEEVTAPDRTIPRAIIVSLFGVIVAYALVATTVLITLGGGATTSTTPLSDVAVAAGWPGLTPVIRFAAAAASLGALLALLTGIGRTSLAMARERDLPDFLAHVEPRWQVPRRAELTIGVLVTGIVLVADLRGVIAFSSFGVLLYYLITNVAAFRQRRGARRYPRAMQVIGALGCLMLMSTLPVDAAAIGIGVVLVGVGCRMLRRGGGDRLRPGA